MAYREATGLTPEQAAQLAEEMFARFPHDAAVITGRLMQSFARLDPETLDRFTAKAPDRQAQTLTQFAKLAGLSQPDKLHVSADITVSPKHIRALSDMELAQRLAALEAATRPMLSDGQTTEQTQARTHEGQPARDLSGAKPPSDLSDLGRETTR